MISQMHSYALYVVYVWCKWQNKSIIMIVIIIIKKQDSLEVFFVRPATNVIILNQILVGCNLNKTKLFFLNF